MARGSNRLQAISRVLKDAGAVKPEEINAVGFMLGDKKAGPFKMEIEWIKMEIEWIKVERVEESK